MSRLIIIESPYAGNIERNIRYAQAALTHSLSLGEVPFAGHLLYTQVLEDLDLEQRKIGITAHLRWMRRADKVAVYTDLGISPGMSQGIAEATKLSLPVVYRTLPGWATP